MGVRWEDFVTVAKQWVEENPNHGDGAFLNELTESKDRLRHTKIKKIRQLICAVLKCNKPWEVVVGQAIGALAYEDLENSNMLVDFLGKEMVVNIIFQNMV